ncbi:class I adenylate-forming enzyme family protein [Lentibacillus populi]|uniref:class I adenylate-forming enzyme family protein n=1 Tax=Lentibacillus populi TaxID=1827502 RepID=UPI001665C62E|nr:class I adenylate-forming enzyme family protein [Lentibacillus populi]
MVTLNERRKTFELKNKEWTPEPVHELFFRMAKQYQNKAFIISDQKKWSYADTEDLSKKFSTGLMDLGIKQHDHVALIFPNYPEFIFTKFGVAAAGGITVPLNYRLKKEEFAYLIKQSDSSFIVTVDEWNDINYVSMLKELCPEVFKRNQSEQFPNLKGIIVFSPQGKNYPGTTDFYDLVFSIERGRAESVMNRIPKAQASDVTDIMYTSGTTSMPKGVLVTHDMIWRSAFGSCINRGYQEGRSIFIPIPFYHCFGYIEGIIAGSMVGGILILQINFNESEALDLMEQHQATDILCVPTIGLKLVDVQQQQPRDLSKLQSMYCAGAEVSNQMWKDIKHELKIKELNTGYGMTECAAGVLQTDPNDPISYLSKYVGCVIPGGHVGPDELDGKNITFKVRDIDTGEDLPLGKEGELVCRGPLVTGGYYNKEKETAETIDHDGWLKTGDLAVIDENGYISLTGRIKEIYRMGAENVAPKEIEDVLTSHELINQAYVTGVPDPVMGEVGLAWIVLEQEASLSEKKIFEYASKRLARYKVPKYIKVVEKHELPMTPVGKVLKRQLKDWFIDEQGKVESHF